MSVGDSAEEFISIHALGRERLLVLSCGLPSHPAVSSRLFFLRYSVGRNNGITSRGGRCCHSVANKTV